MKKRALVLMGLATIISFSVALACWIAVPLEETVKRSPVVVVGKIVKIDVTEKADTAVDIAHIRVARVLKNELAKPIEADGEVLLRMPGRNRTVHSSIDITYSQGQEGVWILETSDKGDSFAATYPDDFQGLEQEKEIIDIVAKQKAEKSEK